MRDNQIFEFPYGGILVFIFCCGQLLYAYTMNSLSMNPDFYNYMVGTAKVPKPILKLNESRIHNREWIKGWDKTKAIELVKRFKGGNWAIDELNSIEDDHKVMPW